MIPQQKYLHIFIMITTYLILYEISYEKVTMLNTVNT